MLSQKVTPKFNMYCGTNAVLRTVHILLWQPPSWLWNFSDGSEHFGF